MAEDIVPEKRSSDLGVRTLSAIVMLLIVGLAFWQGGVVLQILLVALFVGLMWEWIFLVRRMTRNILLRVLLIGVGFVYMGLPIGLVWHTTAGGSTLLSSMTFIPMIGAVIATDIGAYFTGRTIGGPKLAPRISPNKTWSGLLGGMVLAALWAALIVLPFAGRYDMLSIVTVAGVGAAIGVIAQAGDLLESWMKRRAGVKDSGRLIPGHGGLFDRLDGYLPVFFLSALFLLLFPR